MKEVYLDNSATTRAYRRSANWCRSVMCEDYGNPSSMHNNGVESEQYIKEAKDTFARLWKYSKKKCTLLPAEPKVTTGKIGAARANKRAGNHLITSSIEHPAIINTLRWKRRKGSV